MKCTTVLMFLAALTLRITQAAIQDATEAMIPDAENAGLEARNLSSYSADKEKKMWTAHASLGLAAWAILAPSAFSASWFRKLLSRWGGLWFKIHFYCNILVAISTLIAFTLAVLIYNNDGDEHFDDTHQKMGLSILVLVTVQATNGLFRPAAPHAKVTDDNNDDDDEPADRDKCDAEVSAEKPSGSAIAIMTSN